MNNLSRCYGAGVGVARNESNALRWLLETVAANSWSDDADGSAWIRLAKMHLEGHGVPRDRRKALRQLELAVGAGSSVEGAHSLRVARQQRKRAAPRRR